MARYEPLFGRFLNADREIGCHCGNTNEHPSHDVDGTTPGVDCPGIKPEFEWPCYKRKPHGPHTIEQERMPTRKEMVLGVEWTPLKECPGLRAHPATMIGGRYAQEDIPA